MTDSAPTVSIGLPVYNGERLVAQALYSLLDHDFIATATRRETRTFRLLHNPENLGLARNLNRAFDLARHILSGVSPTMTSILANPCAALSRHSTRSPCRPVCDRSLSC